MRLMLISFALAMIAAPSAAQSASDNAGVRATALNYTEGWWTGNAGRMSRAVYPRLAKRFLFKEDNGGSGFGPIEIPCSHEAKIPVRCGGAFQPMPVQHDVTRSLLRSQLEHRLGTVRDDPMRGVWGAAVGCVVGAVLLYGLSDREGRDTAPGWGCLIGGVAGGAIAENWEEISRPSPQRLGPDATATEGSTTQLHMVKRGA